MSEPGPAITKDLPQFRSPTPNVDSFHRALQAALKARVALDLGLAIAANQSRPPIKTPSGRLTLNKLHALQALVQTSPPDEFGRPADPSTILAAVFGARATDLPQKYVNGLSVYLVTGRTDLVLDAMSVDIRAHQELSRAARPSLAYLAALVCTGLLGSGVIVFMLAVLDDLREDLLRLPHSLAISSAATSWMTETRLFALPWIALLALLIAGASLLTPVAAGIAKCLGGFGYLISQRRATAARVEHALVLAGIQGAEAEQIAVRLSGSQPKRTGTNAKGTHNQPSPSHLERSSLEVKHYVARSNARLRQLRFGLPLLLVLTIGSAGVLLYSLALFVPLTNLLYEMAAPVVDPAQRWGNQ